MLISMASPVEVYGAIPFSNSDGVDATWRWNSGSLKNVTHGFIGRTEVVAPGNTHLKARKLAGLSNTAEIWTWRACRPPRQPPVPA